MIKQEIFEYIFMLKQKLFRRNAYREYLNLKKNEKKTFKEIEKINFQKRKKIVEHVYKNVEFYHNLYNKFDFHPKQLNYPEDWKEIPIISKKIIKENTNKFLSQNVSENRLMKSSTGGSTGEPLTVYHDKKFPIETIGWRLLDWWNVKKGNNMAFVLRNTKKNFWESLKNKIMWFPTKRIWLNASDIKEKDINEFIKKFNEIKPTILEGYVGGIEYLADYIKNNDIKIHSPELVWVTAAPITSTKKQIIESAFDSIVYDQYGCGEIFWLAGQCQERNGLHFFSDVRHIEFVNKKNNIVDDGSYGDVLITDLENYAFPIIRYKNGDRGRYLKHNCNCDYPFPLIDQIKGRKSDLIKSLDGNVITGEYITTIFDDYPKVIKNFQIHQYKDYSINFLVVPNENKSNHKQIIFKIFNEFKNKFSSNQEVELKYVNKIYSDEGKTRYVISDL